MVKIEIHLAIPAASKSFLDSWIVFMKIFNAPSFCGTATATAAGAFAPPLTVKSGRVVPCAKPSTKAKVAMKIALTLIVDTAMLF